MSYFSAYGNSSEDELTPNSRSFVSAKRGSFSSGKRVYVFACNTFFVTFTLLVVLFVLILPLFFLFQATSRY